MQRQPYDYGQDGLNGFPLCEQVKYEELVVVQQPTTTPPPQLAPMTTTFATKPATSTTTVAASIPMVLPSATMTTTAKNATTSSNLACVEVLSEGEPMPRNANLLTEGAWTREKTTLKSSFAAKQNFTPFMMPDVNIVAAMSNCTPDEIAELIRGIQNSVYMLGLEEARQCRRAKLLGILKPKAESNDQKENLNWSETAQDVVESGSTL